MCKNGWGSDVNIYTGPTGDPSDPEPWQRHLVGRSVAGEAESWASRLPS